MLIPGISWEFEQLSLPLAHGSWAPSILATAPAETGLVGDMALTYSRKTENLKVPPGAQDDVLTW